MGPHVQDFKFAARESPVCVQRSRGPQPSRGPPSSRMPRVEVSCTVPSCSAPAWLTRRVLVAGLLLVLTVCLIVGLSLTLADDEGSADDPYAFTHSFEWAAIIVTPAILGPYTWRAEQVAGAYADPSMKVAILPLPGITNDTIALNSASANVSRALLYSLWARGNAAISLPCEDLVAAGENSTTRPIFGVPQTESGACFNFVFDESRSRSTFQMGPPYSPSAAIAVFTEHVPMEFENSRHFFRDSFGIDVEPLVEIRMRTCLQAITSGGGHGHGHRALSGDHNDPAEGVGDEGPADASPDDASPDDGHRALSGDHDHDDPFCYQLWCSDPSLCADTCPYGGDGECDDGGAGADYWSCPHATDCFDCGPRCVQAPLPPMPPVPVDLQSETASSHGSARDTALRLVWTIMMVLGTVCGVALLLICSCACSMWHDEQQITHGMTKLPRSGKTSSTQRSARIPVREVELISAAHDVEVEMQEIDGEPRNRHEDGPDNAATDGNEPATDGDEGSGVGVDATDRD